MINFRCGLLNCVSLILGVLMEIIPHSKAHLKLCFKKFYIIDIKLYLLMNLVIILSLNFIN